MLGGIDDPECSLNEQLTFQQFCTISDFQKETMCLGKETVIKIRMSFNIIMQQNQNMKFRPIAWLQSRYFGLLLPEILKFKHSSEYSVGCPSVCSWFSDRVKGLPIPNAEYPYCVLVGESEQTSEVEFPDLFKNHLL